MEIKNISYNAVGTIDCEINHPDYGWIPFTAQPDDVEEMGRTIYNEVLNGDHGVIADYVAPILTTEELLAMERNKRDNLLEELDHFVSNPLRWGSCTDGEKQSLSSYRQLLLDVPQQDGFPETVIWPEKPEVLK